MLVPEPKVPLEIMDGQSQLKIVLAPGSFCHADRQYHSNNDFQNKNAPLLRMGERHSDD